MKVTTIVEIVGSILVPIVIVTMGYFIKALNEQIYSIKELTTEELNDLEQELRVTLSKENHIREVSRVDKDIGNFAVTRKKERSCFRLSQGLAMQLKTGSLATSPRLA